MQSLPEAQSALKHANQLVMSERICDIIFIRGSSTLKPNGDFCFLGLSFLLRSSVYIIILSTFKMALGTFLELLHLRYALGRRLSYTFAKFGIGMFLSFHNVWQLSNK